MYEEFKSYSGHYSVAWSNISTNKLFYELVSWWRQPLPLVNNLRHAVVWTTLFVFDIPAISEDRSKCDSFEKIGALSISTFLKTIRAGMEMRSRGLPQATYNAHHRQQGEFWELDAVGQAIASTCHIGPTSLNIYYMKLFVWFDLVGLCHEVAIFS